MSVYLKTNLRRSSTKLRVTFLVLTLLSPAVSLFSQQLVDASLVDDSTVQVAMDYTYAEQVLSSIASGYVSEIRYVIRVYQKNRLFGGFYPDEVVFRDEVIKSARLDPLDKFYLITVDDSMEFRYADVFEFVDAFFSVHDTPIRCPEGENKSRYYVAVKVTLRCVRKVPPVTVLNLFFDPYEYESEWVRLPLADAERTGGQ